jgi:hypothetical protein
VPVIVPASRGSVGTCIATSVLSGSPGAQRETDEPLGQLISEPPHPFASVNARPVASVYRQMCHVRLCDHSSRK